MGSQERWLVLLANRSKARFFVGSAEGLEETDQLEDDVHRQHSQGGWSQARYQRGVDKEVEDHLGHAADTAFDLFKLRGFDRLLVGGPEETIGDLEAKLHPYLQERLVGRISCDVENAGLDAVRACAGEKIAEFARGREREALDRMAQGVGSGGRGAAGLAEVLAALNEARVEILLIGPGMTAAGVCDPATNLLYATPEEVPEGATAVPIEDIVEKAIEKAIEQSADVIGVRHHDDLGPLGGIGAVLRY